jgi:ATP-dependent Clp protease protease subunit
VKNSTIGSNPLKVKVEDAVSMPVIVRVNKFGPESSTKFSEQFSYAHSIDQPVIPVVVDSFGGTVYDLMGMLDTIEQSDRPVATIVEGKAFSCGAFLFSAGSEGYRFMGPYSTLMIHQVSISDMDTKTVEELGVTSAELNRINRILFSRMAISCGHEPDYFMDLLNEKRHNADWYMDPREAVRHNLANNVGLPEYTTEVTVERRFEFDHDLWKPWNKGLRRRKRN